MNTTDRAREYLQTLLRLILLNKNGTYVCEKKHKKRQKKAK